MYCPRLHSDYQVLEQSILIHVIILVDNLSYFVFTKVHCVEEWRAAHSFVVCWCIVQVIGA